METLLFTIMLLGLLSSDAKANNCSFTKITRHNLEIEISDKEYLQMIMEFSYGDEAKTLMSGARKVQSVLFYEGTKNNSQATALQIDYSSAKAADIAEKHLQKKWGSSKEHMVLRNNKLVTWFGNNRLTVECFKKFAAEQNLKKVPKL